MAENGISNNKEESERLAIPSSHLKDGGLEDALGVDERLCLPVAGRDGDDALGVRQHAVPREQHRPRR